MTDRAYYAACLACLLAFSALAAWLEHRNHTNHREVQPVWVDEERRSDPPGAR